MELINIDIVYIYLFAVSLLKAMILFMPMLALSHNLCGQTHCFYTLIFVSQLLHPLSTARSHTLRIVKVVSILIYFYFHYEIYCFE
jgi:hypothetical protein